MIITLRLLHIVLGAIWIGTMFFSTFFLGPAFEEAGPDAGKVMGALQRRGMMTLLPIIAIGTLLSGAALYWIVSDGMSAAYVHSRMGRALAAGGILATIAYIVGITTMRPAMMKAAALGASMASASEQDRARIQGELVQLRKRGKMTGHIVATLLMLAVALMAVARYL